MLRRGQKQLMELSKLPKNSKQRFNCSHLPLFPTIPVKNVIIDTLHLFLQIRDLLVNLLVMELRQQDGIEKVLLWIVLKMLIWTLYENDDCLIPFSWYVDTTSKVLKYRDLNGPEKIVKNVHLLFPNLPKVH